MKTEKIKKYLKEHKTEIIAGACVVGVAVVGGLVGFHTGRNYRGKNEYLVNNEVCKKVFMSIPDGALVRTFGGNSSIPIKAADLGVLGKFMEEFGVPEGDAFTHFIAIGKVEKP